MKKSFLSILLIAVMLLQSAACFALGVSAEDAYVDLTTLKPTASSVGWGSLGVNKDLNGGPIDLTAPGGGTKAYETGFVAHAPSTLEFDISSMDAKMFKAEVGIDHNSANAATGSASVKFLVYADSTLQYESPVLSYDSAALPITVEIPAGTKKLKLVTDDCGGNTGDHSAWGEPRLYADGSALEVLTSIEVATEKNVYPVGAQVPILVTCKNLAGREMTPSSIEYSCSNEQIAAVSADGVLTGISAGMVRVTVTATDGDVSVSKTVAVSFLASVEEKDFAISSPDGKLTLNAKLDEEGRVSFTVSDSDGTTALERSYIGVDTELCDFSNAFIFVKQIPQTEVDETYQNYSGKHSTVRNHYNQTVLVFEKDVYYFDVYFRMYNDGFAYRFAIRCKDGGEETLNVVGEAGTFDIPDKTYMYAEMINEVTSSFCYETGYVGQTVERISNTPTKFVCFPALLGYTDADGKSTGKYMLLSEADLYSDCYFGSVLSINGDNTFTLAPAPKVAYDTKTVVTTDFASPWRYGIYGELADIVESDLTDNLAPAPEGDYSWVVPGVTAWMWLSEGYQGQRTEATLRDYVDLAAEMGWKYLILDEGWQPNSSRPGRAYDGYFRYFDSLLKYAEEKGVGFIAWVKYVDLDTPEEREILREWAAKGIKGIKADFFDSEDQATLEGFKAIYELCAECHLIVNCHGAGKPTGERRTYPNVINREAVNGEEYGGFWVDNAVVWAFTRNVIGPIDITPRLYPTAGGNTIGAQMACNIIFESGIPCMASDSEDYRGFNGISFYKDLPAAWDDTKLVNGKVGSYVSIARRSGDIWYASTLTYVQRKNMKMPLSFLGDGFYQAEIYTTDPANKTKQVLIETKTVTQNDSLAVSLVRQDGFVVRFTPVEGDAQTEALNAPFAPGAFVAWALNKG